MRNWWFAVAILGLGCGGDISGGSYVLDAGTGGTGTGGTSSTGGRTSSTGGRTSSTGGRMASGGAGGSGGSGGFGYGGIVGLGGVGTGGFVGSGGAVTGGSVGSGGASSYVCNPNAVDICVQCLNTQCCAEMQACRANSICWGNGNNVDPGSNGEVLRFHECMVNAYIATGTVTSSDVVTCAVTAAVGAVPDNTTQAATPESENRCASEP